MTEIMRRDFAAHETMDETMNQTHVQELKWDEAAITDNMAASARLERAQFLARPAVMLGLVPQPDGGKWSVLYGSNIMEGIVGFGDTPDEAMADFDRAWKEGKTPEARRLERAE